MGVKSSSLGQFLVLSPSYSYLQPCTHFSDPALQQRRGHCHRIAVGEPRLCRAVMAAARGLSQSRCHRAGVGTRGRGAAPSWLSRPQTRRSRQHNVLFVHEWVWERPGAAEQMAMLSPGETRAGAARGELGDLARSAAVFSYCIPFMCWWNDP